MSNVQMKLQLSSLGVSDGRARVVLLAGLGFSQMELVGAAVRNGDVAAMLIRSGFTAGLIGNPTGSGAITMLSKVFTL